MEVGASSPKLYSIAHACVQVSSTRQSRRSTTNINHLSLAPLTHSNDSLSPSDIDTNQARHISYIAGKSAPTTPSILSRNPSTTRLLPRRRQVPLQQLTLTTLHKSQSSSQLFPQPNQPVPKPTRSTARRPPPSETLLRFAASLTSTTAESKGQSWLSTRASSTSLVDIPTPSADLDLHLDLDPDLNSSYTTSTILDRRESISFADDEFSPYSTRSSRFPSRLGSRRNSLGAGRGAGLGMTTRSEGVTSKGGQGKTGLTGNSDGVIGGGVFLDGNGFVADDREEEEEEEEEEGGEVIEPDFVDALERIEAMQIERGIERAREEEEEDREMRGLTRGRKGVSGWLGWGLFTGKVEGGTENEGDDEEDDDEDNEEDHRLEEEEENNKVKGTKEYRDPPRIDIVKLASQPVEGVDDDGEGGWADAAFLLSVASKILL